MTEREVRPWPSLCNYKDGECGKCDRRRLPYCAQAVAAQTRAKGLPGVGWEAPSSASWPGTEFPVGQVHGGEYAQEPEPLAASYVYGSGKGGAWEMVANAALSPSNPVYSKEMHAWLRDDEYITDCGCSRCYPARYVSRSGTPVTAVHVLGEKTAREKDRLYREINGLSSLPDTYGAWRDQWVKTGIPYALERMTDHATADTEIPEEKAPEKPPEKKRHRTPPAVVTSAVTSAAILGPLIAFTSRAGTDAKISAGICLFLILWAALNVVFSFFKE